MNSWVEGNSLRRCSVGPTRCEVTADRKQLTRSSSPQSGTYWLTCIVSDQRVVMSMEGGGGGGGEPG